MLKLQVFWYIYYIYLIYFVIQHIIFIFLTFPPVCKIKLLLGRSELSIFFFTTWTTASLISWEISSSPVTLNISDSMVSVDKILDSHSCVWFIFNLAPQSSRSTFKSFIKWKIFFDGKMLAAMCLQFGQFKVSFSLPLIIGRRQIIQMACSHGDIVTGPSNGFPHWQQLRIPGGKWSRFALSRNDLSVSNRERVSSSFLESFFFPYFKH